MTGGGNVAVNSFNRLPRNPIEYFNLRRAVASLIGALVLTATVHESWRIYRHRPIDSKDWWPVRAWHCFSALNNGRKLLSTTTSSSDNLGCVHGFRFLSTTWVILGHTWVQEQFTANYTFYKMVQVGI